MFTFTEDSPDFWIQLKGERAGQPLRQPSPNSTGVKADIDVFDPRYLYYCFLHTYNTGIYRSLLKGSVIPYIRLQDITTAFVETMCVQGVRL